VVSDERLTVNILRSGSVIDGYHMGFTMRFPRALSIREDLTVADCQTVSCKSYSIYVVLAHGLDQLSLRISALRRRELWTILTSKLFGIEGSCFANEWKTCEETKDGEGC